MVFAIEEINMNQSVLPNITLGFSIYDSCDSVLMSLLKAMQLLSGEGNPVPNFSCKNPVPLAALIGEDKSSHSIPLARLFGVYKFPQISFASSATILSDKIQFPSFLRTTPSDDFQSFAIAKLIMHFKWTWIGIIFEDSTYGFQGTQTLIAEIEKSGVCTEFVITIPTSYSITRIMYIMDIIDKSTTSVIVVFSTNYIFKPVMIEITNRNITGKTWIASDGWATFADLPTNVMNTFQGVLGFSVRRGNIPGFHNFLSHLHPSRSPQDIFLQEFWEQTFHCKWPTKNGLQNLNATLNELVRVCTGNESLLGKDIPFLDISDLSSTYNAFNAVYSIAHAIHTMISCEEGKGPFANKSCAQVHNFEPWQLLHYIKHVHFTNVNGDEVFYDTNGNPPGIYDIINWQVTQGKSSPFVKVGHFNSQSKPEQALFINQSAIIWNEGRKKVPLSVCSNSCPPGYRKTMQNGKPPCCFDCISCDNGEISNITDAAYCLKCFDDYWPNEEGDKCIIKPVEFLSYDEPLGAALSASAVTIAIFIAIVFIVFIKYRNTPIVKANNRNLSYILLGSLLFTVVCPFAFIGEPTNIECFIRQAAFGIIFTICVSCILAKAIMVILAFRATKPNSSLKRWVSPKAGNFIVVVSTLFQVIICSIWLQHFPPFLQKNTTFKLGTVIIECNEGSNAAFWCMLGYMGIMAMISFVVAFLSRKLPDSFNEAKFITFSMLMFVSVWLSFIPAYLSTQGKYMAAVEVFAMLSSSLGLLSCIFLPKCYIVLLRPDLNTKEQLLDRGATRTRKNINAL
ncbi:extracellular calcium-sensing receptor-like [Bombina bombina]|uniref:extracellular calcium-sensing receptor-like n=1 Tax=Bombina bombina TaxID=8345 RepID=UPI00235B033D|nr:extracellular calcium-sensing receptor-like [Bombina bombina]